MPYDHTVCEIPPELIENYPFEELEWKPNPQGVCGMIRNPPKMEEFFDIVKEHFPGTKLGLNMASKLIPRQSIPVHIDRHDQDCRNRVHIPLKTNPHSYFYTGREFFYMETGKAYVIDPGVDHGVVNLGLDERIHLIFNMVN